MQALSPSLAVRSPKNAHATLTTTYTSSWLPVYLYKYQPRYFLQVSQYRVEFQHSDFGSGADLTSLRLPAVPYFIQVRIIHWSRLLFALPIGFNLTSVYSTSRVRGAQQAEHRHSSRTRITTIHNVAYTDNNSSKPQTIQQRYTARLEITLLSTQGVPRKPANMGTTNQTYPGPSRCGNNVAARGQRPQASQNTQNYTHQCRNFCRISLRRR